ncbi:hypothetical protein [Sinobaca sp. H24]|uniref:hypothetical protein n=1 Tax=Sinobaca sp. H24 TaxID=2923376 RepID=UPI00207A735B|nr:hypothetical protein [Sinobaca sp. H24]
MTLKWDVQIGDAAIGDVRSSHPNPGPVWSRDQKHIYFLASERGSTGYTRWICSAKLKLYMKKRIIYSAFPIMQRKTFLSQE